MEETIKKISLGTFGTEPISVEQILDKGKVNQVFKVVVGGTPYIFRLNKKEYFNTYQKEYFCIRKAREAQIPTSEVHFLGLENETSYMILNYINGVNGSEIPEEERGDIYKKLGEYASKFNQVKLEGFGRNVVDEKRGFVKNWNIFYQESIDGLFGDDMLINKGVLTEKQSGLIQERLSEMKGWGVSPRLCHGNLHITNTIVNSEGVCVIDWGNGSGNLAPHTDLADLVAWKDRKYIDCFLDGYGMTKEEFNKIRHDVHNLLIIQLLDVIKRSFKIGKKFKDTGFIKGSVSRILNLK